MYLRELFDTLFPIAYIITAVIKLFIKSGEKMKSLLYWIGILIEDQ